MLKAAAAVCQLKVKTDACSRCQQSSEFQHFSHFKIRNQDMDGILSCLCDCPCAFTPFTVPNGAEAVPSIEQGLVWGEEKL